MPAQALAVAATLLRLVHGVMSTKLDTGFDLTPYGEAPPDLLRRAGEIGSLAPAITPGAGGLSDFRRQLQSFFTVYYAERSDRGYPVWHPLPLQFPDDSECLRHADEFMLGDEMLVAPIYEPGDTRPVYLPRGIWTDRETNEVFQGRRTVKVSSPGLPVFARNAASCRSTPWRGPAWHLHYYPQLGAEFFLLESDIGLIPRSTPLLPLISCDWRLNRRKSGCMSGWCTMWNGRLWWVSRIGCIAKRLHVKYWQTGAGFTTHKNVHLRVRLGANEDDVVNLSF